MSEARQVLKAIVVANGRCPDAALLPAGTLDDAQIVVAADGGALCALSLGLRPDAAVGDADSLGPSGLAELNRLGVVFRRVSPEKEESDLQLAVREALERGATEMVILGALEGDRVEHAVANLLLLTLPEIAGLDARIVDERSTVRLLAAGAGSTGSATLELQGRSGDFVSLFPWAGAAEGITTEGLRYALRDEELQPGPSRGLSNELTGPNATVRLRGGRLLIVHTRRSDGAGNESTDRARRQEADT